MNINQPKTEDNGWNIVKDREDAEKFLSQFMYFHDSVIVKIEYIPNPEPYQRNDGSASWNTSLKIDYNIYSVTDALNEENTDNTPVRKSIEVDFKRVRRFNFIPFDEGGCNILSKANIVFADECLLWGELPGLYDGINEYGFTDKKTWVLCEEIRWRDTDHKNLW